MLNLYIFYPLQLAACVLAYRRGGQPEIVVATALLLAATASTISGFTMQTTFASVDLPGALVDVVLLCGLVAVAATADRFWPLWLAALQLVTVAIHAVRAYDPQLVPWMYAGAVAKISYPMLAILVAGVLRHVRRKLAHGTVRDWTPREVLLR